jgi:predicted metal-dependent enzyme (double-stranded beta helix superfamily)
METVPCRPAPGHAGFPGQAKLVAVIDDAVGLGDPQAVAPALRQALSALIRDPDVVLPDCVQAPVTDRYARRELYRSPAHGYSVIAMTWGPGQGTPLHDHSGLWCVEGVWQGALDITQYELLERAGERFRFRAAGTVHAGSGSAGSLIPPHEYHTIRNASGDGIAISLHVYQAPLDACARFCPLGGEWFVRETACLASDAA